EVIEPRAWPFEVGQLGVVQRARVAVLNERRQRSGDDLRRAVSGFDAGGRRAEQFGESGGAHWAPPSGSSAATSAGVRHASWSHATIAVLPLTSSTVPASRSGPVPAITRSHARIMMHRLRPWL